MHDVCFPAILPHSSRHLHQHLVFHVAITLDPLYLWKFETAPTYIQAHLRRIIDWLSQCAMAYPEMHGKVLNHIVALSCSSNNSRDTARSSPASESL